MFQAINNVFYHPVILQEGDLFKMMIFVLSGSQLYSIITIRLNCIIAICFEQLQSCCIATLSKIEIDSICHKYLGPVLLTWTDFNPIMIK